MLLAFFFLLPSVGHLYSAQTRIALWGEHLNKGEDICHLSHSEIKLLISSYCLRNNFKNLHAEKSTRWGKLLNQLLHNTVLNPLSLSSL